MAPVPQKRLVRFCAQLLPSPVAAIGAGGDAEELKEVTTIRHLLEIYSVAVWTADAKQLKAFYHDSAVFNGSVGDRTMVFTPDEQFADLEKQGMEGKSLQHRGVPKDFRQVLSIDLFGQVATAVVQEEVSSQSVIDAFHLMKIDGQWRIVSQLSVGARPIRASPLKEVAAVREVLDKYTEGTWTADAALLEGLFHEKAVMNGYIGKAKMLGGPKPFIQEMTKLATKGESFKAKGLPYKGEVVSLRVYGQMAEAVVQETGYSGVLAFTDAFHLMKVDGAWKIVSKLFTGAKQK